MKVLIFTTQIYQLGGAEKLAIELVHGLNRSNVETHLAILYKSEKGSDDECVDQLKNEGYLINKYYLLNAKVNPGIKDVFRLTNVLKKIIQSEKFDYVETSMITPSIIATMATLFGKCHHLVGFHQSFQKWMYKDAKYKLFSILTWIARQNRYYGISNFVINSWRIEKWLRIPESVSYTLYNNISEKLSDSEGALYHKPSIMDVKGKKILCVGRITTLKGYHILFNSIKNDLVSYDWNLYFVGEVHMAVTEDAIVYKNIKDEIDRLKINDRVHFISFTNDVTSYMKYCDLLVHPTQFEGFGLVLVEAMHLKVPIITTNVEAIPEIVNGAGIVQLNYADTIGLRNAIVKYLNESFNEKDIIIQNSYVRSKQFTLRNRVKCFSEIINN